jgi:hypothetical protein
MRKLIFAILLLFANRLCAIDRYVDSYASSNQTTIFSTLSSAVMAALNGDRILIINMDFPTANLTIDKSLQILPNTPGMQFSYNRDIVISGFEGMNLEITGLILGQSSFSSNPITIPVTNRAKVSIINCVAENIIFCFEYYDLSIIGNTINNGICYTYGRAISNSSKYIVVVDESQNDLNTTDNILIINNTVQYLIGYYNNDYPYIISNNSTRDFAIRRWNANQNATNYFTNNTISNDATIHISFVGVPRYNLTFSNNKFLGTFYGLSNGCGGVDDYSNFYTQSFDPYNYSLWFDYNTWFPSWSWCCNGPSGWYCSNWPACNTPPTRPPNFACRSWISGGSYNFPNATVPGLFLWTYNGVGFNSVTPPPSNLSVITGPANDINGGEPAHKYYDIDLTVNDRGRNGGPFTGTNYITGSGKAMISYLNIPSDFFPNVQLDVHADSYCGNLALGTTGSGLKILNAEYFVGLFDPGQGNGIPVSAKDGNFDHGFEKLLRSQATWSISNNPTLFNIRAKDADGQWGPLFKKTVFPYGIYPNAQLIAEGDSIKVCRNDSVTLTYNGPNGYVPSWFNGTTGNTVTFTTNSSGYYSVSAISGNSTYIDSIYVGFLNSPIPTITPSGSLLVCATSALTLSTASVANNSYQWYLNNNPISGAINSTFLPTQIGNYYVIATSITNGCSGSSDTTHLISSLVISPSGVINSSCANLITLTAPVGTGNIYQWKQNGVNISGATSNTYIPSVSGNYSVTLINGTCVSTSPVTTINYTGSVSTPIITASGPTTICSGNSITLTSSSSVGNLWSNGNTTQSINVTTAGAYSVTVTNIGCSATSPPTIVTVNPLPSNAGAISGSTTVCQGQNLITYSVPVITNATSYVWTLPTGATGSSTTNSINVNYNSSSVSGNITVKGTNSCGDGTTSTLAIIVNPLPSNAGVITGTATICQGQSSITYSVPVITNASSYVWTLPVGASGSSTTNTITVNFGTNAVTGNITVKGINSCGDGTASTIFVVVNPLPSNAGTIAGVTSVCQGQNSITYTVPVITNASSYLWTLPVGASGSSTTNTITVNFGTNAVTGNITVKGINSCGDGNASTINVLVNPLPSNAGTIAGVTSVCQGQNSITYTVPIITNASSYLWTLPIGASGSSTTNSIIVNYNFNASSGDVSVSGNNGCGLGSPSLLSIIVNSKPPAPIITYNGTTFNSNAISGNQWYDENGIIAGETNQNYNTLTNGTYYCIVTLLGCESDTSNIINLNTTSFKNSELKFEFLTYPNPISNQLNIEINSNNSNLQLEILNTIGQLIYSDKISSKKTIDTSRLSSGVYYIIISGESKFMYKKVVKY